MATSFQAALRDVREAGGAGGVRSFEKARYLFRPPPRRQNAALGTLSRFASVGLDRPHPLFSSHECESLRFSYDGRMMIIVGSNSPYFQDKPFSVAPFSSP